MRILTDVEEAAKRLEELIELAMRGDEVLVCRDGKPVAELIAISRTAGQADDLWAVMAAGRASVPAGTTSNHDEFYDEHGLPR